MGQKCNPTVYESALSKTGTSDGMLRRAFSQTHLIDDYNLR
jgi:hypothetical protein